MPSNLPRGVFQQFRVLTSLHRMNLFRNVNAYQLLQLIERGKVVEFDRGDEVYPPVADARKASYFLLVIDGELRIDMRDDEDDYMSPLLSLRAGDTFGELAYVLDQPSTVPIIAQRQTVVLFFLRQDFEWMMDNSAPFRRAVIHGVESLAGSAGKMIRRQLKFKRNRFPGELVTFEPADDAVDLPLEAYARLLAHGVVDSFPRCRVVLARISADGDGEPLDRDGTGRLFEIVVAPDRLDAALDKVPHPLQYVFVLPDEDHGPYERLVASLGERPSRVRLWTEPPQHDVDEEYLGPQLLETQLLRDEPYTYSWRRRLGRSMELGEGRGLARGVPRLECRIKLDLHEVAAAWSGGGVDALAAMARDKTDELARWARALTGRQVGFALGGGGAWGYAHVALLRAMHDNGVPVDIISGASFGSVVGGYYSVLGLEGLDLLVERGPLLAQIAKTSMLSTRPMEELLARDFGEARLEETPTLFHPYTTNLTSGKGVALASGSVALAVRASGSAPGVFGPTIIANQGRYVDGCVVNNVPTVVLYARNASLRVGANIYPPPDARPVRQRGWMRRLQQFDPIGRLLDAEASGSLLLHVDGVRETASATVVYDVVDAGGRSPLETASQFGDAAEIVELAGRNERLKQAAQIAADQWKDLVQRRAR